MSTASTLRSSQLHDIILWLLRRRRRFRVTGPSMLPLLKPGQEVLLNPYAYRQQLPQPDDIVVARHPQKPHLWLVKRVQFVEADGRCYLKGDNITASTDSRQLGLIAATELLGQVVCRFP